MFNKKIKMKILIALLAVSAEAAAFAPTNLLTSHDWALRFPANRHDHRFNLGLYKLEGGSKNSGRTWDGKSANVLALHDVTQSTLAMIRNVVATADDARTTMLGLFFANNIAPIVGGLDAVDNGVRGHQRLTGNFEQLDASVYADYQFLHDNAGDWSLALHVPVTYKKVSGFKSEDLTLSAGNLAFNGPANAAVRRMLTNNFVANVKALGNVDLSDWNETGIGDIVALLNWQRTVKMCKKTDRSMTFYAKAGISLPSGKEKDEDKAFSMALGNDGAWGVPLGLGVAFQPVKMFRLGLDGELLVLLDKSRSRRLMTHVNQTEFILLNKGNANKNHGLTWQLHAWAQAYHVADGLSFSAAYHYVQHDQDTLNSLASGFDSAVVNAANSLKEWHIHNALFKMNYDFLQYSKTSFSPHVSLFYKAAFSGKNIIDTSTWGGQLTVSF